MNESIQKSMLFVDIDRFTLRQPSYEENINLISLGELNKIINNNIFFL